MSWEDCFGDRDFQVQEDTTSEEVLYDVPDELVRNYFNSLINCFFKILPLRESGEETVPVYLESLKLEMLGCNNILKSIHNDARYLTLISILQYFIDHPNCRLYQVKREVFRAIRICNEISERYSAVM